MADDWRLLLILIAILAISVVRLSIHNKQYIYIYIYIYAAEIWSPLGRPMTNRAYVYLRRYIYIFYNVERVAVAGIHWLTKCSGSLACTKINGFFSEIKTLSRVTRCLILKHAGH